MADQIRLPLTACGWINKKNQNSRQPKEIEYN